MAVRTLGAHPLVDADSHVTEPADLWTSRVPKKYALDVPRVDFNPATQHNHWRIGDNWLFPAAGISQAGWKEVWPSGPLEFEDIEPGTYIAEERIKRMDQLGIDVQVLFPNIVGFHAVLIQALGPELAIMCVQAYNDFIVEWSSVDSTRLIPIGMLPFWDQDASVREMERCKGMGMRGVLMANKFEKIGLPTYTDPYWDPIYGAAQRLDLPICYHIGFANFEDNFTADVLTKKRSEDDKAQEIINRKNAALEATLGFMIQPSLIGALITSGVCERFPDLQFASIETGLGNVAFYLECLDWHWKSNGNVSDLLPSEYFRRQCFGTFWFERQTLGLLDEYPDNFMFATDYPHPTSLSPGPASPLGEQTPAEWASEVYSKLDPTIRNKVLFENANKLFKLHLTTPA